MEMIEMTREFINLIGSIINITLAFALFYATLTLI